MTNININDLITTKVPLRFSEDGKYRILMISDIHAGRGYAADLTVRALDALIEEYKPDLVLMGGDIAGPGYIHVENEADLRDVLDSLTSPMEKRGIAWAHVYGNHDDNYGLANAEHQKIYETYPHCVSKAGPEELTGVGNYVLPIYDAEGKKILFNVFGFDSNHGIYDYREEYGLGEKVRFYHPLPGSGDEDGMHFDQVMYYWNMSCALEEYNGAKIPAMMYMHIPLPEHALVSQLIDKVKFEGTQLEQVACTIVNPGVYSACLQRGDVKGIFCGHDHVNDFCATYGGIKIGYDGFLSYHACHRNEIRGGRIIDLDVNKLPEIDTYMVRVRDVLGLSGDTPRG